MRVLFHYTHKQTPEHTTRSIALATALCRHGAEVLILQEGVPHHLTLNIYTVKLNK